MEMDKLVFIRQNGAPCFNYINTINGMYELYAFLHNSILTFRGMGFDCDEIRKLCINQVNYLMYSTKTIHIESDDFDKVNDLLLIKASEPAEDWIQNILSVNCAEYKSCKHYYSTYDKENTSCKLCPYSKNFQNNTLIFECALIRFALNSKEDAKKIADEVPLERFKGLYDLSSKVQGKTRPVLFELTKSMMTFLFTSPLFENSSDMDLIRNELQSFVLKEMRSISEKEHSSALIRTLSGTVKQAMKYVFDTPFECTLEKAISFITFSAPPKLKNDGIVYATSSNLGTENLNTYYKEEKREPDTLIDKDYIQNAIWGDAPIPDETKESEPTSTVSSFTETESASETEEKPKNEKPPSIVIEEIGNTDNNLYPWEHSMVVVPYVDTNELFHFAINLDAGDARLHSIVANHLIPNNGPAKEGVLSIDFISVGNGKYAYLIYIPRLSTYFFTSFQNSDVKSILSQALSFGSIKKYCYQPYILLSQLRKIGITPKNVTSLFSISEVLYPSHQMNIEICLEKLGAFPLTSIKGNPTSTVLKYMHCYHRIFKLRHQDIISSGKDNFFHEENLFSLALSYSFLHPAKGGDGCLFYMNSAGNYHFLSPSDYREVKEKNSFRISIEYSPISTSYIIRKLITELYKRFIFKSGDVSILCLGTDFITYSVPVKKNLWFESRVHHALLMIEQEEGIKGLEYRKVSVKWDDFSKSKE